MNRHSFFSPFEMLLAAGFVGLIGFALYPPVTRAVLEFLNGLPWNP
jgi:hypothetical protein